MPMEIICRHIDIDTEEAKILTNINHQKHYCRKSQNEVIMGLNIGNFLNHQKIDKRKRFNKLQVSNKGNNH